MKQTYKTNAEFLREANELNKKYKKEHRGKSMFTPKFEQLLKHLFESEEFKEMPDHLINAELNDILQPMEEK